MKAKQKFPNDNLSLKAENTADLKVINTIVDQLKSGGVEIALIEKSKKPEMKKLTKK